MATLENAITLAVQQHTGQLDKGGQPYILHPLRVMLQLQQPDQQIVAVLHDILEDTHTTAQDLQNLGFQTILFTNPEQLERELMDRGLF